MVVSFVLIFGCGVMINYWVDIKNVNFVVVMGGNVVEVYLVGFCWVMEVKIYNGVKLIVIDFCFMCMVVVVDYYVFICFGIDIVFLLGVLLYLLNNEKFNCEYIEVYINVSLIVCEDYGFEDGLFIGYDVEKCKYDKFFWIYELDENGFVKCDIML